jgi:hypothetical protein
MSKKIMENEGIQASYLGRNERKRKQVGQGVRRPAGQPGRLVLTGGSVRFFRFFITSVSRN